MFAVQKFWQLLGPEFVAGAADDDPSGIGTYSQAGAQYYALGGTPFLTHFFDSVVAE